MPFTAELRFHFAIESCQASGVFAEHVAQAANAVLSHPSLFHDTRYRMQSAAFVFSEGQSTEPAVSPAGIVAHYRIEGRVSVSVEAAEDMSRRLPQVVASLGVSTGERGTGIGPGLTSADGNAVDANAVAPLVGEDTAGAALVYASAASAAGIAGDDLEAVAFAARHGDGVFVLSFAIPIRHQQAAVFVKTPHGFGPGDGFCPIAVAPIGVLCGNPRVAIGAGLRAGEPYEVVAVDLHRPGIARLGVVGEFLVVTLADLVYGLFAVGTNSLHLGPEQAHDEILVLCGKTPAGE